MDRTTNAPQAMPQRPPMLHIGQNSKIAAFLRPFEKLSLFVVVTSGLMVIMLFLTLVGLAQGPKASFEAHFYPTTTILFIVLGISAFLCWNITTSDVIEAPMPSMGPFLMLVCVMCFVAAASKGVSGIGSAGFIAAMVLLLFWAGMAIEPPNGQFYEILSYFGNKRRFNGSPLENNGGGSGGATVTTTSGQTQQPQQKYTAATEGPNGASSLKLPTDYSCDQIQSPGTTNNNNSSQNTLEGNFEKSSSMELGFTGRAGLVAGPAPVTNSGVLKRPNNLELYRVRVRANFRYTASNADPTEISFEKGEIMHVTTIEGAHWWNARKSDGKTGIVPSNYIELYPETNP